MFEQVLDPVANSLFWSAALAAAPLILLVLFMALVFLQSTPILGWMVP